MDSLNLADNASALVERGRSLAERLGLSGMWHIQHIRDGQVLAEFDTPNGITDVGIHNLLDTGFRGTSQISTWYAGLVDNAGFSAFAAGDTMASHAGWAESTAYGDANRRTWSPGAAGTRQLTNGTTMDFAINGTATIKGIFIASNNTKGGSTGTLWSTAAFGSNVAVQNGDTLKVTYTLSG
jgi:hypothetical protein